MNDTEAISWIEQLAHEGALVWASCRPAMAGGGWAVRIIGPSGPDRMGHGATLGEALADALRGVEGVRSILKGGDRGGPTRESERAKLVAEVGECCRGADPMCAAGCLVEAALRQRLRA